MVVEIFNLCDTASICGGKICLIGSFDTLTSVEFPVELKYSCIATKIRSEASEPTTYSIWSQIVDESGNAVSVAEQQEITLKYDEPFSNVNRIAGLTLKGPGRFKVQLIIDSEIVITIPLKVEQRLAK